MRFVSRALLCFLVAPALGCGALLDFDPADPDASAADLGASLDGGTRRDAGPRDMSVDGPVRDMFVDLGHDAGLRDLGPDAAPSPCLGMPDGTDCSPDAGSVRLLCIMGTCVGSSCGDGYVDSAAGERCEPSLDPACDPLTCRYQCESDTDCPPSPTTCSLPACGGHFCGYVVNPATAGHGCVIGVGVMGICRSGACVPPGCGNGIVDTGEDCDPGTTSIPGCYACHYLCRTNVDCSDGDPCNGDEQCQRVSTGGMEGQLCQAGAPVVCDASDLCHVAACGGSTATGARCTELLIDLDGDGHAPPAPDGSCGDDCDDFDPYVHPGAPEVCNGRDDNCNGVIDEGTTPVMWCFDGDGDGYGDPRTVMTSCAPPASGGFVRDCTDCYDTPDPVLRDVAAQVNPGQTAWFTTPYCHMTSPTGPTVCSFDYNCDTRMTPLDTSTVTCGVLPLPLCDGTSGWSGPVPGCGMPGSWATCYTAMIGAGTLLCQAAIAAGFVQACQ